MEFEDDAFVLSARPFGETGAIVELVTRAHGKYAAHVAGAASRRMKPFLQAGARVTSATAPAPPTSWARRRWSRPGRGPRPCSTTGWRWPGSPSATAVAAGALPEREPHPGAFFGLEALIASLEAPDIWPAVYVRFEAGLLADLGFGLDLSKCAVTGSADDLIYVSPRTGRAVSAAAGEAYKDRLLALPPFLLSAQGGLGPGDIASGLAITGHFLERFVFAPLNRPLPPARLWLRDRLEEAGRL